MRFQIKKINLNAIIINVTNIVIYITIFVPSNIYIYIYAFAPQIYIVTPVGLNTQVILQYKWQLNEELIRILIIHTSSANQR